MIQQHILHNTSKIIPTARLARQMEWRKANASALCVWLGDSASSVAIGFHPSQHRAPQQLLHNSRIQQDSNSTTTAALQATLSQFQHLPLVIGWPLQANGTCGAACGRVLHTLDRIVDDAKARTSITLYTPSPTTSQSSKFYPDCFGRDPSYATTSHKQCHLASHEQYNQHSLSHVQSATDLWKTICSDVWDVATDDDDYYYNHNDDDGETVDDEWKYASSAPSSLVQYKAAA